MKTIRLTMLCLLLGALSVGNAWADRGRGGHRSHSSHSTHFGVVIGPYWGAPYYSPFPRYYPPYYPYYPPVVIERPVPQVYIELPQEAVAPPAPSAAAPVNYWYYCAETNGYYPYVKECRSGWQKVLPQPSPQP